VLHCIGVVITLHCYVVLVHVKSFHCVGHCIVCCIASLRYVVLVIMLHCCVHHCIGHCITVLVAVLQWCCIAFIALSCCICVGFSWCCIQSMLGCIIESLLYCFCCSAQQSLLCHYFIVIVRVSITLLLLFAVCTLMNMSELGTIQKIQIHLML